MSLLTSIKSKYTVKSFQLKATFSTPTCQEIQKPSKGFSLVELMAVVVILGILISAAIPAYSNYVRNSREMRATTQLQTIAMKLEKHYNRTMSYQASLGDLNLPAQDNWFQYRIVSDHQKQYIIVASPLNPQVSPQEFSLNHYGLHQRRILGTREWVNGWS